MLHEKEIYDLLERCYEEHGYWELLKRWEAAARVLEKEGSVGEVESANRAMKTLCEEVVFSKRKTLLT